jgi:hypothetical protein
MSKFIRFIEALLLPAIAITSLVISLGDMFNIFHLIPAGQIPVLTLLLISMALGSLSFIQNKFNEMQRDIEKLLSKAELERIDKIILQINPELRKVLSDEFFANIPILLKIAMKEHRVQVNDLTNFRFPFKHMLQSYSRATFLSTSSLATSYFWNDSEIVQALTCFIRGGGKIKQIFFVKDLEEMASMEMKVALDILQKIGISVKVVNSANIPPELKKYFFVESRKKIAWETPIYNQGHVGPSVVTSDEQTTTNYYKIFEKLWDSAQ